MPTVRDILDNINEEWSLSGSTERTVTKVMPIDEADSDSLSFIADEKGFHFLNDSGAGIIICPWVTEAVLEMDYEHKTIIEVENPKLVFIRLLKKLFTPKEEGFIHPSASIGAHCYIAPSVEIGKNVIIHPNTTIGTDGFGFLKNENGEWEKFPSLGGVIIEDNVEIGSNCAIDRGALGNTVIREGSKLDNLIHIAHNVKIGKHCAIVAVTMIGGSAQIGDYTWIAPQVCVRDQVKIGRHCLVGMGSVVTKDVPDNTVVMGVPAKEVKRND